MDQAARRAGNRHAQTLRWLDEHDASSGHHGARRQRGAGVAAAPVRPDAAPRRGLRARAGAGDDCALPGEVDLSRAAGTRGARARRLRRSRQGHLRPAAPQLGRLAFRDAADLGHYTADRAELLWRASEIFAAIGAGTLRVTVGGRYPFEDAARAYDDLAARRTTGKLLVVP
ncbi:MAG TPA: zinc-binding dehydrogenase [Jatrophihabitans sp.]